MICNLTWLFVVGSVIGQASSTVCRYWTGEYLEPSVFKPLACCHCYETLFRAIGHVGSGFCNYTTSRIQAANDPSVSFSPSLEQSSEICDLVGSQAKCFDWTECCSAATTCCDKMVASKRSADGAACPATWDMFTCWGEAEPGETPQTDCPSYLLDNVQQCIHRDIHYVHRNCTSTGKWSNSMSKYIPETNYTKCGDPFDCLTPLYNAKHIIEITCEAVSLVFVIPALSIFLSYRNLLSQQRIRVHINLFISLLLYEVSFMIYELTVRNPILVEHVVSTNSIECRLLNAITKFTTLSLFSWMLMEGFFLHWLMVNTFVQPKFIFFLLSGWGLPLIFSLIYAIVKVTDHHANIGCWFSSPNYDWIIHTPLLVSLVLNIIFLVNILRVIRRQLQAHQNEPSTYSRAWVNLTGENLKGRETATEYDCRRAVKAVAMLVPPFGLVLVFNLYSPDSEKNMKIKATYDCVAAAFLHLQGVIISIILCYSNTEVMTSLKKTLRNWPICQKYNWLQTTDGPTTTMTHISRRQSCLDQTTDGRPLLNSQTAPVNNNNLDVKQTETCLSSSTGY